jgi:hypothetical protein
MQPDEPQPRMPEFPDCLCRWDKQVEFWAGEPVEDWFIAEIHRRCPDHGKPRHKKQA